LPAVRRMLAEADNIRRTIQTVKDHTSVKRLRIGTTHTHAMYTLRPVFKRFSQTHPKVLLELRQSNPTHIAELVAASEVDIGIAAEPLQRPLGVSFQPCFKIEHGVFMPRGHPLESLAEITLADLSKYPIITYDASFRLGRVVRHSFRASGLGLNVVINATDSDTTKAFVESGFGIAILPKLVYDPARDVTVSMVDVNHLFESSYCHLITVEGRELDRHQQDFIAEFFESAPAFVKQHLAEINAL
jgi:DNA-binding transcriptional LysR family regulator